MKIGIECEGRFQGLKTLFVNYDEFVALRTKKLPAVEQIYISDHDNKLDLNLPELQKINDWMGIRITVERTKFETAPYYINIMLVVDNESFWNLRGHDQIKFSKDLTVYSVLKHNMDFTDPVEFRSDVNVEMSSLKDF